MMSFNRFAPAFGAALLVASPAFAITVSNRDAKEHVLTVDRGMQEDDTRMAPGTSVQVDCPEGCALRVRGSGYDRPAEPGDRLVIDRSGLLHYADDLATGSVRTGAPAATK
jgi:hypothetical protein